MKRCVLFVVLGLVPASGASAETTVTLSAATSRAPGQPTQSSATATLTSKLSNGASGSVSGTVSSNGGSSIQGQVTFAITH